MNDGRCTEQSCDRRVVARLLCGRHYQSRRKSGTLPPPPESDVREEFWRRVQQTDSCWLWIGTISKYGYGHFSIKGRPHRAHRISYIWAKGAVPDGLVLDHLCRNRACVNPDHLEAVTPRVNSLRGIGPSAINAQKTRCAKGHELTPRGGHRECDECNLQRQRRYQARQRELSRVCGAPAKRGLCTRVTKHPSGLCQHHRTSAGATS